jgi:dihydrolipoamide dehydrogenase
MSNLIEVIVPDIGNFDSVDVIEVLVKVGDTVAKEDSLITLESDKASMDIPSSDAGVIKEIKVKVGDKIAKGSPILALEAEAASAVQTEAPKAQTPKAEAAPATPESQPAVSAPTSAALQGDNDVTCEVVVLGSGPGGYCCFPRC